MNYTLPAIQNAFLQPYLEVKMTGVMNLFSTFSDPTFTFSPIDNSFLGTYIVTIQMKGPNYLDMGSSKSFNVIVLPKIE